MKQDKVEQALVLLEQAKALLQNHPNGNVKRSEDYLHETIRQLRQEHSSTV